MFARYVSAITGGTFITLCLLFAMHALIDMQPSALSEDRPRIPLVWATARDPEPVRIYDKINFEMEDFTTSVELPDRTPVEGENPGVSFSLQPATKPNGRYSMPNFVPTDGPLVAVVRVSPEYPMRANGREGYVIVQFDVLASGKVSNAVVVESSDHVFNKSAIKAAERSRFRARMVDGIALASTGIQMLYRFEMEGL